MKSLILFSGGKDSSLVAHLLKNLGYEIKLITANFGLVPSSVKTAQETAKILDLEHEILNLNPDTIQEAADTCEQDKNPAKAIDYIHKQVLEEACKKYGNEYKLIADGSRRDDKTPKLTVPEMRSLEDRRGVEYFCPLMGFSYKTINYLTQNIFKIEEVKAGAKETSEYEIEIRAVLRARGGEALEKVIFPENHYHSIVVGLK